MHNTQIMLDAVQTPSRESVSINKVRTAQSLHALFEAQAKRTPDAIAAEYAGRTLTYKKLNDEATRFGSVLASQGVEREKIVGIGLQRSLQLPIAIFGVLKAGGVCMPLDPEYPAERLAYMMEDAGVEVLIAEQEIEERLSQREPARDYGES